MISEQSLSSLYARFQVSFVGNFIVIAPDKNENVVAAAAAEGYMISVFSDRIVMSFEWIALSNSVDVLPGRLLLNSNKLSLSFDKR